MRSLSRGIPLEQFLWWALGPPAMILCELGQARKGAAAAGDSCAGMWLGARHPNSPSFSLSTYDSLSLRFLA